MVLLVNDDAFRINNNTFDPGTTQIDSYGS
jgi:hypothetical protein